MEDLAIIEYCKAPTAGLYIAGSENASEPSL